MKYYFDRKFLIKCINIMNSVYEIGNKAHENLIEEYFISATFIDTVINFNDFSQQESVYLLSLIYKKVNEATSYHMRLGDDLPVF